MRPTLYKTVKQCLLAVCRPYFRLRIEGTEHVPREGPVILAANHASALDPPLLGMAAPRPVHFMAKEELFRIPVLGPLLREVGSFPVRRGEFDRRALETASAVLAAGGVLGVFPEGSRTRDGRLGPARRGVAFLACKAQVPVVPVGILGTYRALAGGRRLPRRETVVVRFGPPLAPPQGDARDRALLDRFSARLMHEIALLLGEDFCYSATNG